MSISNDHPVRWVFLTGGTGLLGSAVVQELLKRGHHVLCLVQAGTPGEARSRVAAALDVLGGDANSFLVQGRLAVIRGDIRQSRLGLTTAMVQRLTGKIGSVIHAAGSTSFSSTSDAHLACTNVEGTKNVFELAAACVCRDWHLFSTAYVCGRCASADEVFLDLPPEFRNEYEWTKWRAEQESRGLARCAGAVLTTYRPSVIVGHSQTGAISDFRGIYRVFRAVALLARAAEARGDLDRHQIPLRLPADEKACPNLVFLDEVTREFVELFERPQARGRVFHLTHPDPPSNGKIQKALERYYNIGGGRFVGQDDPIPKSHRNAYEEVFFDAVLDTEPYILESPQFNRRETDGLVSQLPTPWTQDRLLCQIHFAEMSAWRRPKADRNPPWEIDGDYQAYFERFMPQAHRRFRMSKLDGLNLNVRFVVGRLQDGDWLCRYWDGRLIHVGPTNGIPPDVTYRISPSTFWNIVRNQLAAADLFLSGHVQLEGDVERGLKFAVILQEFVREFPFRQMNKYGAG